MQNNTRYENKLWYIFTSRFEFLAAPHARSKLFLSLRPVVPILKMRGKKDIRKNGSREHPSTSLIPSFGRRSQGNFRPHIFFHTSFMGPAKGAKYFAANRPFSLVSSKCRRIAGPSSGPLLTGYRFCRTRSAKKKRKLYSREYRIKYFVAVEYSEDFPRSVDRGITGENGTLTAKGPLI